MRFNTKVTRLAFVATTALATATLLASCGSFSGADSGTYPSDTITLISPYGAGGSSDQLIRPIADGLSKELDAEVVVEYKEGGSGALGTNTLINSKPDGYTIGYGTAGTLVSTPLAEDVGYTYEDVETLGIIAVYPSVLAVSSQAPYQSAKEFISYAKKNPGEISVGVTGASTPMAIEMKRWEDEYGIEVKLIPFETQTKIVAALLGGNIDATFNNLDANLQQLIDEGDVTPILVSTEERSSALPDVPTFVESGYDLTLGGSTGMLLTPKDVPEDIETTLTDALKTVMQDPKLRERVGEHLIPADFQGADAIRELLENTSTAYEPYFEK